MAAAAIGASFLLVQLDALVSARAIKELGWLYTFGPEGARAILSAIASSMITVAGLTFSITMLTLQLASSQFGPRLLRNFMRDRGNQVVLGTFIATFVYCLLVLRTVRGTEESSFVQHISVAFGLLLALGSIAVLIYFIHHVASSIRIETLLARLAGETHQAIDRLYPERIGSEPPAEHRAAPSLPTGFADLARPVCAAEGGYVQRVDVDALMKPAKAHDLLVRVEARPGRFVAAGDPLLLAFPGERVPDAACRELREAIAIGAERTPEQDLEYSIRRIVEIAQRALSPGVNDPTTALYCIDRLDEGLRRLAVRDMPSPVRYDDGNRPRVLSETASFDELACAAFAAIARYGTKDADVIGRLLAAIDAVTDAAGGHPVPGTLDLARELRGESGLCVLDEARRARGP